MMNDHIMETKIWIYSTIFNTQKLVQPVQFLHKVTQLHVGMF